MQHHTTKPETGHHLIMITVGAAACGYHQLIVASMQDQSLKCGLSKVARLQCLPQAEFGSLQARLACQAPDFLFCLHCLEPLYFMHSVIWVVVPPTEHVVRLTLSQEGAKTVDFSMPQLDPSCRACLQLVTSHGHGLTWPLSHLSTSNCPPAAADRHTQTSQGHGGCWARSQRKMCRCPPAAAERVVQTSHLQGGSWAATKESTENLLSTFAAAAAATGLQHRQPTAPLLSHCAQGSHSVTEVVLWVVVADLRLSIMRAGRYREGEAAS